MPYDCVRSVPFSLYLIGGRRVPFISLNYEEGCKANILTGNIMVVVK